MHRHVVLLWITIRLTMRKSFSQKDMMQLLHRSISNPKISQMSHPLNRQTSFLAQLTTSKLFSPNISRLPATLRKLKERRSNRIPKLPHQPQKLALRGLLQRNNDDSMFLVHHAINAALPIVALNNVFPHRTPRIPVNLSATDRLDRHKALQPPCYRLKRCKV